MRQLILSDITRRHGHINDSEIFELTWVEVETLGVWTTIVDTAYRNYTRSGWAEIIDHNQLGIYNGLIATVKRDRDQLQVVSADSYPQLVAAMTEQEIEQLIEIRQQQAVDQGLFEFG